MRVGEVPETVTGQQEGGRLRCRIATVTQDSRPPAPSRNADRRLARQCSAARRTSSSDRNKSMFPPRNSWKNVLKLEGLRKQNL